MTAPSTTTVTLVSAVRLRPGSEAAHARLHHDAVEEATQLGGLVRSELVSAIPGVQPETVALLTFTDRTTLDRWIDSDERSHALAQMTRLTEGDRTLTVVGDFAGWFSPASVGEPARWKQALVGRCQVAGRWAVEDRGSPGLGGPGGQAAAMAVSVI
jgi:antibiotic biosynthesis monooxygenase (ABM) superfamily enzyme